VTMLDGDTGLVEGVSFEDYLAWPGVSRSGLWTLYGRTPAHFRWEQDHAEEVETEAMRLGTAVHAAILEPERFAEVYITGGPVNPKTGNPYGRDTKKFAEWAAEQDALVLSESDFEMCQALGAAVHAHPHAGPLVKEMRREVSIQWQHGPTGTLMKSRLDGVADTKTGGLILVDLKTTRSAAPQRFGADAYRMGYLWQMAAYRMGLVATAEQEVEKVLLVAIEKEPPYGVAVYQPDEAQLTLGESQVTDALRQLELCKRFGDWPGYPEGIEDLMLPGYAGAEWTPFAGGLEVVLEARAERAGRPIPEAPVDDDDDGYLGY